MFCVTLGCWSLLDGKSVWGPTAVFIARVNGEALLIYEFIYVILELDAFVAITKVMVPISTMILIHCSASLSLSSDCGIMNTRICQI